MDFMEVGRSETVYWALLLQPVDESLTKFRRVGLGLLYPRAWEMVDGKVTACEII